MKDVFKDLADEWERETEFVSSIRVMTNLRSFKKLADFGPVAIPLIIERYKTSNAFWNLLLREITGVNPVKQTSIGNVDRIKDDWVNWSLERGINGM